MERKVEVLCRQETVETESVVDQRTGKTHVLKTYVYPLRWFPEGDFVDSKGFKDQQYNENVAPDVHNQTFGHDSVIKVGEFYSVNKDEVKKSFGTTTLQNPFTHALQAALPKPDKQGFWSYTKGSSYIERKKRKDKDSAGDLRVHYLVMNHFNRLDREQVQMTVCGVTQADGTIKPMEQFARSVAHGVVPLEQLIRNSPNNG